MAEKRQFKYDIFKVLKALDSRDKNFLDTLGDEERKVVEQSMVVILRWMSSIENYEEGSEYTPWLVNESANIGFYDLYKHPELQWKTLAISGSGKPAKHKWIKNSPKSNLKAPKTEALLKRKYPLANYKEIDMIIKMMTAVDAKELIEFYGVQKDDAKKIKEEVKKYK